MNTVERQFVHRTFLVAGIITLYVLASLLVIFAVDVVLVIFGGLLLAVFIRSLSNGLRRRTGWSDRVSVAIVLIMLGLVIGALIWFLAAEISGQFDQLARKLPQTWGELRKRIEQQPWGRQLFGMLPAPEQGVAQGGDIATRLARVFSSSLGALVSFFVIVFIGLYLAIDPDWYRRGALRIVPPRRRRKAARLFAMIGTTLRWWLIGRVISMVAVGLITGVGLWLLGVPLALALGTIAFLLDFIPFVGPILAAMPALLLAVAASPGQAASVALLYLGVQFAEGYIITPLIEQRSVRLPPALTISTQVLLGVGAGALGVLFATPLTAAVVTVVQKLYVEDTLGDHTKKDPE